MRGLRSPGAGGDVTRSIYPWGMGIGQGMTGPQMTQMTQVGRIGPSARRHSRQKIRKTCSLRLRRHPERGAICAICAICVICGFFLIDLSMPGMVLRGRTGRVGLVQDDQLAGPGAALVRDRAVDAHRDEEQREVEQ